MNRRIADHDALIIVDVQLDFCPGATNRVPTFLCNIEANNMGRNRRNRYEVRFNG